MPRPIWKGYIAFGLVPIPVFLYPLEKKIETHLKLVDNRDNSPIRYVKVNAHTGETVAWENITKAYQYKTNQYIPLDKNDLKKIAGENSKVINIDSFISKDNLQTFYFEKPYYIIPHKKSEKAYVLLREALYRTKKIAVAKIIIHTREYLSALIPYENALTINLLRYEKEIRKPPEIDLPSLNIDQYHISPNELEAAEELVSVMTTPWEPAKYRDKYKEILQEWIEKKVNDLKSPLLNTIMEKIEFKPNHDINFFALLKESLKNKKSGSV